MTITPKYNIGDTLYLKANGVSSQIHEFHVDSIMAAVSSAGTSIAYRGRLWIEKREPLQNKPTDKPQRYCHGEIWDFGENELTTEKPA